MTQVLETRCQRVSSLSSSTLEDGLLPGRGDVMETTNNVSLLIQRAPPINAIKSHKESPDNKTRQKYARHRYIHPLSEGIFLSAGLAPTRIATRGCCQSQLPELGVEAVRVIYNIHKSEGRISPADNSRYSLYIHVCTLPHSVQALNHVPSPHLMRTCNKCDKITEIVPG